MPSHYIKGLSEAIEKVTNDLTSKSHRTLRKLLVPKRPKHKGVEGVCGRDMESMNEHKRAVRNNDP